MSIAENIKTAEEHLEAESKRELDRLLGTLAEECVYEENLLKRSVRGKEEVAQYYEELWQAFPDVTYVVTNRVADEACVIYEMTFRGTHTGPFRGIPPTGRQGEIKVVKPVAQHCAISTWDRPADKLKGASIAWKPLYSRSLQTATFATSPPW